MNVGVDSNSITLVFHVEGGARARSVSFLRDTRSNYEFIVDRHPLRSFLNIDGRRRRSVAGRAAVALVARPADPHSVRTGPIIAVWADIALAVSVP